MIITAGVARKAAVYLATQDPVLVPIIKAAGPCPLRPHQNYYGALVDSIISQQLSVKAAHSIERRFCELFGSKDFPPAGKIIEKDVDELRTAGLSRPKANYIRDLAQHVVDGKLKFDQFDALTNEEIISELVAVKGIGEWTAHMFLMFCMGRSDVLPVGDLGIKNGLQKLYGLEHMPDANGIKQIANNNNWHPYESIASWYIWQSLSNTPTI